jgi:hypothetical protein
LSLPKQTSAKNTRGEGLENKALLVCRALEPLASLVSRRKDFAKLILGGSKNASKRIPGLKIKVMRLLENQDFFKGTSQWVSASELRDGRREDGCLVPHLHCFPGPCVELVESVAQRGCREGLDLQRRKRYKLS